MRKLILVIILLLTAGNYLSAQTVEMTLQVDMSVEIAVGNFDPATEVVRAAGSFQGWSPGSSPDMVDINNDSIYVMTYTVDADSTYEYKFLIGTDWGNNEFPTGSNRTVDVGAANLTVPPSFYNVYETNTAIQSPITFTVDMRLPAQGSFNPATDSVFVAGNFTNPANWATDPLLMEDPEGDTTFTITVDADSVISGDLLIFKFIWSNGQRTWETNESGDDIIPGSGGNRIYGVHDGANEVSRWFNNTNPNVQLADGNIFFEVDMSVATELGVFDYNVDSVQIRGAFNGWNGNDVDKSHMTQDAANPDHWTIEVPFVQEVLNSNQLYKFFINSADSSYPNTGWEVPIRNTNGTDRNRGIIFMGDPGQTASYAWFGNINPDWVIPAGTSVECTFMVDMTNATLADSQGTDPVFVPATDTVWWIPRQPLYYAVNGLTWPGTYPRVLELTDANSDMVYEGTLTIDGPNFNGFLYNYAFTSSGNLVQEGPAGTVISQGDCRVRFVGQSGGARTFDTPWTMPLDVWSNSPQPEEDHPMGWIDNVKEIPGNPQTYSLEQNFPNPFNPSTTIRFSVPEQGLVTLKVFNLLGEEVTTLINSELANGSYEVDFQATNFSSGIYFYTLKAGNFITTKKMILLK